MSQDLYHSTSKAVRPRLGFTLVELMVVISIIAILTALLIPAVFFAINSAKRARITLEVAALSKGLERYKLETGEYPPDFSELADPALNTPALKAKRAAQLIEAHMSRVYRRRALGSIVTDTASNYVVQNGDWPQNPEGLTDLTVNGRDIMLLANLSPRNALHFWLRGFSPDPQFPLFKVGAREPLMDFDETRLTQNSGVIPFYSEYIPKGDVNNNPYVYFNNESYENPKDWAFVWAAQEWGNNRRAPAPYWSSVLLDQPSAAESFQLISAGLDGEFGVIPGIANVAALGAQTPVQLLQIINYLPSGTNPSGAKIGREHRDNIVSFAGGTVEEFLEE